MILGRYCKGWRNIKSLFVFYSFGINSLFAPLGLLIHCLKLSYTLDLNWIAVFACPCMYVQFVLDPMLTALEAQQSQWECQWLRVRMPFCHVRSTVSHHPPSAGPRRGSSSPLFLPGKTHWESHTQYLWCSVTIQKPLVHCQDIV